MRVDTTGRDSEVAAATDYTCSEACRRKCVRTQVGECHTYVDSACFAARCRSLPLLDSAWHIAKGLMDSDGLDHTSASGGSTQDSPDSLCHWTLGASHVHTSVYPPGRLLQSAQACRQPGVYSL